MTSKIEWCDTSINPVTGCLHDCPYCYAKRMTPRYANRWHVDPGFKPAFHEERLREIIKAKGIVFVVSMGDLFGSWVPTAWIHDVMVAIKANEGKATFMLLTKNPARYTELLKEHPSLVERKNIWLGTSLDQGYIADAPSTDARAVAIHELRYPRKWVSVEPYTPENAGFYNAILDRLDVQWFVFGVRTNPTTKLSERDLDELWKTWSMLRNQGKAVFVKDSIVAQMSGTRQLMAPREFPAGVALVTKSASWSPKVKEE
jgi:protein gp37